MIGLRLSWLAIWRLEMKDYLRKTCKVCYDSLTLFSRTSSSIPRNTLEGSEASKSSSRIGAVDK